MTTDNALALPESMQGPIVVYTPEQILEMAKSGDWLPRLAVATGTSDLVSNNKVQQGVFTLTWDKERFSDLGKQIDIAVYTMRPKALRIASEGIFQYFDQKHPEFIKIMQDSQLPNSGCMFGLEFLIYIPSANQMATFHAGSKSGRREAPGILSAMNTAPEGAPPVFKPSAVSLVSHFIPKTAQRKNSWWSWKATKCSTPLPSQPDLEELEEQIKKFNNPPSSQVEKAETSTSGRER